MGKWAYLVILAGCVVAAGWLEFGFRTRVLRRFIRLILTVAPVLLIFAIWDIYAISAGHWNFDTASITGWSVFGLPLDEIAFFIVIPFCAILTLEAVRSARGWTVGDESADSADGATQ